MKDLFTLSIPEDDVTETAELFEDSHIQLKQPLQNGDGSSAPEGEAGLSEIAFSEPYQAHQDKEVTSVEEKDNRVPHKALRMMPASSTATKDTATTVAAPLSGAAGHQKTLDDLLEITGVHSALQHDVIMDQQRPERLLLDREAQKIANRALRTLIQHHQQQKQTQAVAADNRSSASHQSEARGVSISMTPPKPGIPLNQKGIAGANRPAASSLLLEKMRQRKELTSLPSSAPVSSVTGPTLSSGSAASSSPTHGCTAIDRRGVGLDGEDSGTRIDPEYQELLPIILMFLRQCDGQSATTAEILHATKVKLTNTAHVAVVRAMLRGIATFQKKAKRGAGGTIVASIAETESNHSTTPATPGPSTSSSSPVPLGRRSLAIERRIY